MGGGVVQYDKKASNHIPNAPKARLMCLTISYNINKPLNNFFWLRFDTRRLYFRVQRQIKIVATCLNNEGTIFGR